ncbi:hypothetical protein [uncultured Microbulbifer sp.]|uniref:hypothetical protein n=1 Tax=uncultured Microbulbifer sp. TaxID=348147 RepID=UPI002608F135|nr:hypothetical protein [uncultured Microbulbifer sp.]
MKYVFDKIEIEVIRHGVVKVYFLGRSKGDEFSLSFQRKNKWGRFLSRCEVAQDLPNIVMRRGWRGLKISFDKKEGKFYQFTLVSWLRPILYKTQPMQYVSVETTNQFMVAASAAQNA